MKIYIKSLFAVMLITITSTTMIQTALANDECGDKVSFEHISQAEEKSLIEQAWRDAIAEYEDTYDEPLGMGWIGNLGGGADCDVVANRMEPLLIEKVKALAARDLVLIDEIKVESVVLNGLVLNHVYFIMLDSSGTKIGAADPWRDFTHQNFGPNDPNSWPLQTVTRSDLQLDKASEAAEENYESMENDMCETETDENTAEENMDSEYLLDMPKDDADAETQEPEINYEDDEVEEITTDEQLMEQHKVTTGLNTSVLDANGDKLTGLGVVTATGLINCYSVPGQILDEGTCEDVFEAGTEVTLEYTPYPGFELSSWDSTAGSALSCPCTDQELTCSFEVSKDVKCIAWVKSASVLNMSVSLIGEPQQSIVVKWADQEKSCDSQNANLKSCTYAVTSGLNMSVEAVNKTVAYWYGPLGQHCPCEGSNDNPCTFTLEQTSVCAPFFSPDEEP